MQSIPVCVNYFNFGSVFQEIFFKDFFLETNIFSFGSNVV